MRSVLYVAVSNRSVTTAEHAQLASLLIRCCSHRRRHLRCVLQLKTNYIGMERVHGMESSELFALIDVV